MPTWTKELAPRACLPIQLSKAASCSAAVRGA